MSIPESTGGGSGSRPVRGALLLVVVFAAGAVAGAALDRRWMDSHFITTAAGWRIPSGQMRERPAPTDTPSARLRAAGVPEQFFRLHLTAEQTDTLIEIAQRRRPRADSVNAVIRTLRPTVQRMETEMMQEMLCALTPKQQQEWLDYVRTARWEPGVVEERYRPVREGTCSAAR